MEFRKDLTKRMRARPQMLIALAGVLTVVWVALLIWLPLRLLQLI
jgi:hypothetical protein